MPAPADLSFDDGADEPAPDSGAERPDAAVVAALRSGDEATFTRLVTEWSRSMLLLARGFVSTEASAEEVVQETWLAVIQGLDRFEGRSSLRTWVYRILVNIARRRGQREHRSVPMSSLSTDDGPALDPGLFQGPGGSHPGGWRSPPHAWRPVGSSDALVASATGAGEGHGESSALASEVRAELGGVIDRLPERQRTVLVLRDVLGHSAEEVCDLLEVSSANQRVLLHRARTATRAGLAEFLEVH